MWKPVIHGIVKLKDLQGEGGVEKWKQDEGKYRVFKSRVEDYRRRVDNRLDGDSGMHVDILAGKSPTPRCPLAAPAPIRSELGRASYRLSISRFDSF